MKAIREGLPTTPAFIALVFFGFTTCVRAEGAKIGLRPSVTTSAAGSPLTGKERLGPKWSDEQRIDNCRVPIDKRGTKPRPSACPNLPSS
jgi:hypothetical protein